MSKIKKNSKKRPTILNKKRRLELEKLGLEQSTVIKSEAGKTYMVDTIEELVNQSPGIVCVSVTQDSEIQINDKRIRLKKGKDMVMSYGYYQGLRKKGIGKSIFKPANRTFASRFRRYRGEDLDGKKLMVWRFGGIGDLMFAQPLMKYLRHTYPKSEIVFATSPSNMDLFSMWETHILNGVTYIPFSTDFLDEYDYHMTFEGSIERCREAHNLSAIDTFMKVANVEFDPMDEKFQTKLIPDKESFFKVLPLIPSKTIAFQIRASSPLRTYDMTKAVEIIDMLTDIGFNVGILDNYNEARDIQLLLNAKNVFKNPSKVMNLAGMSSSLKYCVSILEACVGAIATDSSISHLAAALGKPVVGVYGPFRGDIRMNYYKTGDWVNISDTWNECGKAPCYYHDSDLKQCPYIRDNKGYIGCMRAAPTELIVEKFVKLYEKYGEK
jgi:ADP-heptose:LPS heptosyltransferase